MDGWKRFILFQANGMRKWKICLFRQMIHLSSIVIGHKTFINFPNLHLKCQINHSPGKCIHVRKVCNKNEENYTENIFNFPHFESGEGIKLKWRKTVWSGKVSLRFACLHRRIIQIHNQQLGWMSFLRKKENKYFPRFACYFCTKIRKKKEKSVKKLFSCSSKQSLA